MNDSRTTRSRSRAQAAAVPLAGPGGRDHAEDALLALSRLTLAATMRAGRAVTPALSPTQLRLLTVLFDAGDEGISLNSVAEALSTSASAGSRLCSRFESRGLLSKESGPGNELRIRLSAAGVTALTAVNEQRVAHLRGLLDELPTRTADDAISAFTAMAAVAHAGGPASW